MSNLGVKVGLKANWKKIENALAAPPVGNHICL
jgi:hypothetical protein